MARRFKKLVSGWTIDSVSSGEEALECVKQLAAAGDHGDPGGGGGGGGTGGGAPSPRSYYDLITVDHFLTTGVVMLGSTTVSGVVQSSNSFAKRTVYGGIDGAQTIKALRELARRLTNCRTCDDH